MSRDDNNLNKHFDTLEISQWGRRICFCVIRLHVIFIHDGRFVRLTWSQKYSHTTRTAPDHHGQSSTFWGHKMGGGTSSCQSITAADALCVMEAVLCSERAKRKKKRRQWNRSWVVRGACLKHYNMLMLARILCDRSYQPGYKQEGKGSTIREYSCKITERILIYQLICIYHELALCVLIGQYVEKRRRTKCK